QFVGTASWSNMLGDQGAGFFIRRGDGVLSNLHWGSFVAQGLAQGIPGEGHRYNVVRYDTPEIGGFMASASWGEDDHWSVALRYSGQISRFKLSTGIAYIASHDLTSSFRRGVGDTEEVGLSGSILDTESGLYATAAWCQLHDDGLDALYGRNVD